MKCIVELLTDCSCTNIYGCIVCMQSDKLAQSLLLSHSLATVTVSVRPHYCIQFPMKTH